MRRFRPLQLFLPILCVILAVDILSKRIVYECFAVRGFERILVFNDVIGIDGYITYVENTGGAWGIFSDYQYYLLLFRIVVVLALIVYMLIGPFSALRTLSLTLIISGAIGNILDAFFYGHVVDMLSLYLWGYAFPVFNFADISIFFGSMGMILLFLFVKEERHHEEDPGDESYPEP